MTTLARRDDADLARGLAAWCAQRWPDAGYEIAQLDRPRAGWTNETLLVTLRGVGRGGESGRQDDVVLVSHPGKDSRVSPELDVRAADHRRRNAGYVIDEDLIDDRRV